MNCTNKTEGFDAIRSDGPKIFQTFCTLKCTKEIWFWCRTKNI